MSRNFIDLTGKRFGRLTVKERAPNEKRYVGAIWLCVCDCGKQKAVRSSYLRNGPTISCGCAWRSKGDEANFQQKYYKYKNRAKYKGHAFKLSKRQFRAITEGDCFYCGAPPAQRSNQLKNKDPYTHNGIDRVNSRRGYLPDNCVSCCTTCNQMKLDHSVETFREHVSKIYLKFEGGKLKIEKNTIYHIKLSGERVFVEEAERPDGLVLAKRQQHTHDNGDIYVEELWHPEELESEEAFKIQREASQKALAALLKTQGITIIADDSSKLPDPFSN